MMRRNGFTLVEVLVAMALAATITAALTETLIASHRTRHALRLAAEAVRLAESGIEQLAAHGAIEPLDSEAPLQREGTLEAWEPSLQLYRAQVRVRARQSGDTLAELVTLVRR